ncbi:MAG: barstar family protein [Clostridia bacterium]|nr:barstar family protein [Clostridia bacterium]
MRVAFDFPEWYGANLDAFWDLLWSECYADEVVITGVNTMPNDLVEYMFEIYLILDRKAEERNKYGKLYDDIKPLYYRIES